MEGRIGMKAILMNPEDFTDIQVAEVQGSPGTEVTIDVAGKRGGVVRRTYVLKKLLLEHDMLVYKLTGEANVPKKRGKRGETQA